MQGIWQEAREEDMKRYPRYWLNQRLQKAKQDYQKKFVT
jgi:hypothetical protein